MAEAGTIADKLGEARSWERELKMAFKEIRRVVALGVALVAPVLLAHCGLGPLQPQQERPDFPVRFIYKDPHAGSVCLSGSFNGWSPDSHCMSREKDIWLVVVRLPAGRYEYGFIVDGGVWQTDPGSTLSEDTGFGKMNSVLIVE